jgi:hypothetical protein
VIDVTQVPHNKDIIESPWVFKRKLRPNGIITKLKARFCVRGDVQKLPKNESAYVPVVDWGTVQLLFSLSVAHNLPTKQINFRNAFVQSCLPRPIYLELPQGLTDKGNALQQYPLGGCSIYTK